MNQKRTSLLWGRHYDMTNVISPFDLMGFRKFREEHGKEANWSDYKEEIRLLNEEIDACIRAEEEAKLTM